MTGVTKLLVVLITKRGFGGSISGDSFSCLDGDLITGIFNEQTKRQAGPQYVGYSTDIAKVNTWVAASHIHAKVRKILSEKIQLNRSTDHKERTPGSRQNWG